MTGLTALEWIKLAIYYASYFYFIAMPIAVWLIAKQSGKVRWATFAFLIVISCLAYGRFVEPRILLSPTHKIALDRCFADAGEVRIAVFSDMHEGLFGNAMPISKIVRRVNAHDPEFVLVPGDFIYFLDPSQNAQTFEALSRIDAPVFAVLGNHDLGLPGPDLSKGLQEDLPDLDVTLIDDKARRVFAASGEFELVGLSDDWAERQKLSLLEGMPQTPRILLTHNPASVRDFSTDMHVDLLIGGHTHGGQIYLPFLTCKVTGMCGKRRYGLSRAHESYPRRFGHKDSSKHQAETGLADILIFTTSGTGMVGLPMRFRVPPRVDILEISWDQCA